MCISTIGGKKASTFTFRPGVLSRCYSFQFYGRNKKDRHQVLWGAVTTLILMDLQSLDSGRYFLCRLGHDDAARKYRDSWDALWRSI